MIVFVNVEVGSIYTTKESKFYGLNYITYCPWIKQI